MSQSLDQCAWPWARMGEGVALLAKEAGYRPSEMFSPIPPAHLPVTGVNDWLRGMALQVGVELRSAEVSYGGVAEWLGTAVPAILQAPARVGEQEPRFWLLLRRQHHQLVFLAPEATQHTLPLAAVQEALCRPAEEPHRTAVEALLTAAQVPSGRRATAAQRMLRERLQNAPVGRGWLLELSPSAPFHQQLYHAHALRYLLTFLGGHMVQYGLWLTSWAILGQAIFASHVDGGWLYAWALLLLTTTLIQQQVLWAQNTLAVTASGLLQKRLLYGLLRLSPDEVKQEGVGQFMGRAFEVEEIENLALNGGLLSLVAIIELFFAFGILAAGATGWVHVALLGVWLMGSGWLGWQFYRHRQGWTHRRRRLTHHLIEQMLGHLTRLAQVLPANWHRGEDESLSHYVGLSAVHDSTEMGLRLWLARGWLVVAVAALGPMFITAVALDPAPLAITLGGIISAYWALLKLARSLWQLVGAAISWEQLRPLYEAAARPPTTGQPAYLVQPAAVAGETVLAAHHLGFRHTAVRQPILADCSLQVVHGDHILLEGPSGAGKSTLSALLTGLRTPQTGLLLLRGADLATLGENGWHRYVTAAPQFHENHVFGNTFLFNLLLGREWPPAPEDWRKAEAVCHALGLTDLIGRMPAGLLQPVGEIGWQLSHGEKSRLYLARTLLQNTDLIILDESFAALDPHNLQRVFAHMQQAAPTFVLIAHA